MSLTKYEEGSFRELLSMAMPLMLCSFSMMLMLFVDRLLLAHYSTAALNSAVSASTLGWAMLFGWVVLANITEVFVAQYHGAKQLNKMGEPVWQMLWMSQLPRSFSSQWQYGAENGSMDHPIMLKWKERIFAG